ncbi:MFS transporter [Eubacteriales bacterium OttesenSCG-928-M02]|nr:MFS transporter [Eubacteriales bacterium OttesenSCG-928-M02]
MERQHAHWKKRAGLFMVSQNISLFGSSIVGFAIMWYITLQTSSGVWMMLSTLASTLPQVLISLFGGVWADRYNRKMLIMAADAFIAIATLGLAISFLLGWQRLELLLLVSAVRSLGQGIQTPAVNALYPQLVPEAHLTKVQGINQSISSVLMLLSPAVGGMLLGTVGIVWAFFVDVITATLAIGVMALIPVRRQKNLDAQPATLMKDVKKGLRYTFSHRELRRIILCYMAAFFLITPAAVLSPLMVERTFGSEVWRLTANEMVWTVGSLLGGIFLSIKGAFRDKIRVVAICLVAFGITFGLLGVAGSFFVFLLLMGIAGVFMPIIATVQTVYIQEITAPAVLGRVFSIVQIISAGAIPVAILFFGPLADMVPVEGILLVTGILLSLVGIWYGWARGKHLSTGVDAPTENPPT